MLSTSLVSVILDDSDSDDDLELTISAIGELLNKRRRTSPHRGSVYGHAYIWRDRVHGHHKLFHEYFGENPVYSPNLFRRRFRMSQSLFLRIQSAVEAYDPYFVQKRDAVGFLGLSSLQKITAALRMLAYGVAADYVDEYVRIGESTAVESLKKFVKAIVSIFSEKYMRSPNKIDIDRLFKEDDSRGFPGMLGKLVEGRAPLANYSINGHDYTMEYYLADGIYPSWSTFVKTIPFPQSHKHKQFAAAQESARKDVERAFGVLQARFAIVRGPALLWHRETLKDIMKACIILHNMIVEDERHVKNLNYNYDAFDVNPDISISHEQTTKLLEFVQCHRRIRDRDIHSQLQQDLIEHIWKLHGSHI
ncbi:uncharacterized protein LOC116119875 [Pistacia vera]|uniref:uncharacterized protein LOC116119875 n=1 Tax=Pistacia vera TaxID=55513 RepID=UPI001263B2CF|nr:uncharacterized protein LOC116119875 [Pistacia vera]